MKPLLMVGLVLTVASPMGALAAPAAAAAPEKAITVKAPTVSGPVTGGAGRPRIVATAFDLADIGYVAEEYFIEGEATAYTSAKRLSRDGRWKAKAASSAPYKTRILVYRPANAKDFDGTVFVEWLNVTAGFESAPDWGSAHNQIIRAGAVWVGVSAQSVGVQGGVTAVAGAAGGGLRGTDPARYGSLSHPGDSYAYDIFSQAGAAIRSGKPSPLHGLHVKRVIAAGESQSAYYMTTYINAVAPLAHVYDGFLVHSRGGGAARLSQDPQPVIKAPDSTLIRTDVDVPVAVFETETDLLDTGLGYYPSRQPDSKHVRTWEVAGTSHADAYTTSLGFGDIGNGDVEKKLLDVRAITGGPLSCSSPVNAGPAYAVLQAAVFHLERWVRDGTPPPTSPRLDISALPVTLERDEHGIARGGIRTPLVDVPTATLDGLPNGGRAESTVGVGGRNLDLCRLFGGTTPFDDATLAKLYPTHADYVNAFNRSADKAVKAGFILPADAKNLKAAAALTTVGA